MSFNLSYNQIRLYVDNFGLGIGWLAKDPLEKLI